MTELNPDKELIEEFKNISEQKLIDEKADRIWEYAFACAMIKVYGRNNCINDARDMANNARSAFYIFINEKNGTI